MERNELVEERQLVEELVPFFDFAVTDGAEREATVSAAAQQIQDDMPDKSELKVLLQLAKAAIGWKTGTLDPLREDQEGKPGFARTMLEAMQLASKSDAFIKGCGRLSNLMSDIPLLQAVFDTAVDMATNCEYFNGLAEVSAKAWCIAAFESVLRCMCERAKDVHLDQCTRDIACFRWNGEDHKLRAAFEQWRDEQAANAIKMGRASSPLLTSLPTSRSHRPRSSPREYLEASTRGLLTPDFFSRHPLLVVAGGAVNAACIARDAESWRGHAPHDIDIFVVGTRSHTEAAKAIRTVIDDIVEWAAQQSSQWKVMVSVGHNSINVNVGTEADEGLFVASEQMGDAMFEVQLIMRLFRSVEELLLFFDFGACRFAYNGEHFLATNSAMYAVANGFFFLEPAMMTYPKRIIKYDRRGFRALAPVSMGYNKCLSTVMCADREKLVELARLKSLVSLMAFTRLGASMSMSESISTSTGLKRTSEMVDREKPETGLSGDVYKPLEEMYEACKLPVHSADFVEHMFESEGLVWECYVGGTRMPANISFAEKSQVVSVIFERPDLWKLDKPCVNLIRDMNVNFLRTE